MDTPKTREQIAYELGISVTTLWRRLKAHNIQLPKGLVFPQDQERIRAALGYISEDMKKNEKK